MSHIPAAAMPHAQAHHADADADATREVESHSPERDTSDTSDTPWVAMAVGGAVALGGALTAAWLLRRDGKPAERGGKHKAGRGKKAGGKRRASREDRPADA